MDNTQAFFSNLKRGHRFVVIVDEGQENEYPVPFSLVTECPSDDGTVIAQHIRTGVYYLLPPHLVAGV